MKKLGSAAMSAIFLLAIVTVFAGVSHAALTSRATFVGNYGLSTDGWGDTSTTGSISAWAPVGATVTAAYLYANGVGFTSSIYGVRLAGTPVLSVLYPSPWNTSISSKSGIADVTSIVAPIIDFGGGAASSFGPQYNFSITEDGQNDGEALVVVYTLPSLPTATVAILDGPTATTGDTFYAHFATPLDPTAASFFAEMRLGISFSYDDSLTSTLDPGGQVSQVSVNGTTISNNAGNFDDGTAANGGLITVGGSDDPFSPFLPNVGADHERYNLVSQIVKGDTTIAVSTFNASNDDNIFLAAFYLLGEASVDTNPNPTVSEPATLLLLTTGLIGLVGYRRKRRME